MLLDRLQETRTFLFVEEATRYLVFKEDTSWKKSIYLSAIGMVSQRSCERRKRNSNEFLTCLLICIAEIEKLDLEANIPSKNRPFHWLWGERRIGLPVLLGKTAAFGLPTLENCTEEATIQSLGHRLTVNLLFKVRRTLPLWSARSESLLSLRWFKYKNKSKF